MILARSWRPPAEPYASPFLWASWSQVYPLHISAGFAGFRPQISLVQDLNSPGTKGQENATNKEKREQPC